MASNIDATKPVTDSALASAEMRTNFSAAKTEIEALQSGKLANIVEDTTPQLGGQLDVNGQAIGNGTQELLTFTETGSAVNHVNVTNATTTNGPTIGAAGDDTNIDLNIAAKGTGNVTLGNFTFDADQTVGAGQNNYVLTYDSAGDTIQLEAAASGGLSEVVQDTTPQLGGQLDVNGHAIGNGTQELITFTETGSAVNQINITNAATGNGPTIASAGGDANISLNLTPKGTGDLVLDGLKWPQSDGTADYVLKTDGVGQLSWTANTGGGGLANIVEDTTPQLGGQLDVNGYALGNGTLELLSFTETASAVNHVNITNATTTNAPIIAATGDDTNVHLKLAAKGAGNVFVGNFEFNADQSVGSGQDNYVLTYDNGTGTIGLEEAAAGGVSDGDKGDITVSGSGTTWTVDADAITYSKIQNVTTTDRILGRYSAGAGDVQEITCTGAARSVLDDTSTSAMRTTLGVAIGTDVQAANVVTGISSQIATSYTFSASDAGRMVTLTNAASITATVPPNSSVAYTVGTWIYVYQGGVGQVTVAEGAGVTVNSSESLKIAKQHGVVGLLKIATDTWILTGEREAAI